MGWNIIDISFILDDEMDTEQNARHLSYLTVSKEEEEYFKDSCKQFTSEVIEEYENTDRTDLSENQQNTLDSYVNEILHSIFSLAIIHEDDITPDSLFTPEVYESLSEEFPEPFDKYKTHLPKRTPFSVLLDIMNLKYDTKEEVMEKLCRFFENLKFPEELYRSGNKNQYFYTLESTVICVCYNKQSSSQYFGASVCSTKPARRIMINSSCINTWHKHVSYVVMSYMQARPRNGRRNSSLPRLELPQSIECQAYLRDWATNTYREIPPCSNCQRMFSLGNQIYPKSGPYGNCAETDCFSKVLYDDQLRENIQIKGYNCEKMEKLKKVTRRHLRSDLCLISSFRSKLNRMDSLPVFNPSMEVFRDNNLPL